MARAFIIIIVFVIASVVLQTLKVSGLHPMYSRYACFINSGWIRLLLFTGPIYILIVIDLVLSVTAGIKVSTSGQKLLTQDKRRTTRYVITISKLKIIIFGFHWFLMFFTWIEGNTERILWKILGVLISLQGVFVILSQLTTNDRIAKAVARFGMHKSSTSAEGRTSLNKPITKF